MNEKWYQEELDLVNTCKKCGVIDPDGMYADHYGWFCQKHWDQFVQMIDDFLKDKKG